MWMNMLEGWIVGLIVGALELRSSDGWFRCLVCGSLWESLVGVWLWKLVGGDSNNNNCGGGIEWFDWSHVEDYGLGMHKIIQIDGGLNGDMRNVWYDKCSQRRYNLSKTPLHPYYRLIPSVVYPNSSSWPSDAPPPIASFWATASWNCDSTKPSLRPRKQNMLELHIKRSRIRW